MSTLFWTCLPARTPRRQAPDLPPGGESLAPGPVLRLGREEELAAAPGEEGPPRGKCTRFAQVFNGNA